MKNGSLISKIVDGGGCWWRCWPTSAFRPTAISDDPMLTTLAYTYQVEDTVEISGCVVRQEQVLTGDGGGLMQLRRSEGERVSTGGAVATVYADQASLDRQNEIESLTNRIDQLKYAQESILGAEVTLKLDSQIAQTLLDYRSAAAAGRLDTAETHGPGAAFPGFEAGLHLLRHRGPHQPDPGAENPAEDPAVPGGQTP